MSKRKSENPLTLRANAAPQPKSLSLVADATIDIAAAEDGKPAKRPTFAINAYNGGTLRVGHFFRPVVIDLSGLRASQTLPILLDHDATQIVGQAISVKVGARSINLTGMVTGDDEPAQKVLTHAKNGFKWQASVGVQVDKLEVVAENTTVKVNGQSFTGPILVARQGRLGEVSFVAVGADESASARVAAHTKEVGMEFEQWFQAKGFDPAALTDEQRATLQAAYDAEVAAEQAEPQDKDQGKGGGTVNATGAANTDTDGERQDVIANLAEYRKQQAAESKRIADIRAACGKHPAIEVKAITEGWSVEKTELEILRAERPKAPAAGGSSNGQPNSSHVIEASLALSHGVPVKTVEASLPEKEREPVLNAAMSAQYRGVGLHFLMDRVIHAAGVTFAGDRKSNEYIRAAFQADRQIVAAGGFSTVSLSGILSNVANKHLLAAYQAVASVVSDIAREVDTNDFKEFKSYRMTGKGQFQEVGPTGELEHVELQEEEFSNQLKTKGALLALTRQMMVNDDLNAFFQILTILARMAAIAREKALFTEILANPSSFFSAGNANFFDGADTNLQISALTTAVQMFWEQKDANGDPILIAPDRLLVPPALKVIADQLFKDTMVNETTTANKPKINSNPHAGNYRPVASPFLGSKQSLTGNSDTAWYLLASPESGLAIAEVAYLRGRRQPTLESAETDFSTLGMQWRGYFDFGVAMQDKRAGVKSKGAA